MKFVVIGAGAWGTAFAVHLARAGQETILVPRRCEQAEALLMQRMNAEYLPGVPLPENLQVSADLADSVQGAEVILLACPAQALRETGQRLQEVLPPAPRGQLLLSLAKGLELRTHLRPSEVMAEVVSGVVAGSLAGPTNAEEVARGWPAAMVLAAAQRDTLVNQTQAGMSSPTLRVYTSNDLAGVEFGSCLKNIYAIASGCCDGLKLGDNAKAALLTRALTEMVRVGVTLGAHAETFYGLSGFGDLVATCHGDWSRNREFGQQIGEGARAADLIAHRKTVVEGYHTTQAFAELCASRGIDAPILHEVQAILFAGKAPGAALNALMNRGLKSETASPFASMSV